MANKTASKSADFESHKPSSIPGDIWSISNKIRGIGELFRSFNSNLPIDSDEAYVGIGSILVELADALNEIRDEFEGRQYRPAREIPRNFKGDQEDDDAPES